MTDSIDAVRRLRERGIPLFGYTWWPLFALIGWSYRQGARDLERHLLQMGLYDLDPTPGAGLARLETPLVAAYRALVAGNARAVGPKSA
jgi:hypothetical protein